MTPNISVLILTLNEEKNLPRCLETVAWSDDVVVFDSYSTDRTVEIARNFGARIVQRRFDDERSHRTESLRAGFKHPWVFNPDADEFATPELVREMCDAVARDGNRVAAFRVRRMDMFMGRWIRHASLYPTWLVRLFRPESIHFERTINLRYLVNGPEGRLNGHLVHHSFNKGLEEWMHKHNRYSTCEAAESLKSLSTDGLPWGALLSADAVERRRALKELSSRLPARPTLRFLYMYLLRGGCLDGLAGYHYCRLVSLYEYLICLKLKELRRREAGLPV
jgi:glycosyltransferase involved in cell wall biosynthesis